MSLPEPRPAVRADVASGAFVLAVWVAVVAGGAGFWVVVWVLSRWAVS